MHPDRARGVMLRELCRRIKDSADAQALIHTAVYAVLARHICLRLRGASSYTALSQLHDECQRRRGLVSGWFMRSTAKRDINTKAIAKMR